MSDVGERIDKQTLLQRIELTAYRMEARNSTAGDLHAVARWDMPEGPVQHSVCAFDRCAMMFVEGGICWREPVARERRGLNTLVGNSHGV